VFEDIYLEKSSSIGIEYCIWKKAVSNMDINSTVQYRKNIPFDVIRTVLISYNTDKSKVTPDYDRASIADDASSSDICINLYVNGERTRWKLYLHKFELAKMTEYQNIIQMPPRGNIIHVNVPEGYPYSVEHYLNFLRSQFRFLYGNIWPPLHELLDDLPLWYKFANDPKLQYTSFQNACTNLYRIVDY